MHKLLFAFLALALLIVPLHSCGYEEEKLEYVLYDDEPTPASEAPALDPKATIHTMETHIVPGRLNQIFKDTNDLQLEAAIANGIDPVRDLRSAYKMKRPLVKISTSNIYYIDSMRYGMPYLVPKAAKLLADIGRAFQDTIKARGGKEYRIRVNSLLRTEQTVAILQHRNSAATDKSCHLYGTTFDISWTKFDCMDPSYQISLESLKNILAEIVYRLREEQRCYCIFEHKRGCMHITVR